MCVCVCVWHPNGAADLPVHGMEGVGLVVVAALMVTHVDRNGSVERREHVLGGCTGKRREAERER